MRRIFCADTRIINFSESLRYGEMLRWLKTPALDVIHLANGHLAFFDKFGIERGLRPNPRAEELLELAIEDISPWCVCGDIFIVPMADYFPDALESEAAIK